MTSSDDSAHIDPPDLAGSDDLGQTFTEDFQSLAGMTPDAARHYVHEYVVTTKKTAAEIKELAVEVEKWEGRLKLAQDKGLADLIVKTKQRLSELNTKKSSLEAELWGYEQDLPRLKQELAKITAFTPSVDSQGLLDQLENLVGKERIVETKIAEELGEHEVDDELATLKAKLKKKEPPPSSTSA